MALSNIIGDVVIVEMNYCVSVLLYEFKFSPVNLVWHNHTILLQFLDIINNYLWLQFCRCRALVRELVVMMLVVVIRMAITTRTFPHHCILR
jgi:hypothetical protein